MSRELQERSDKIIKELKEALVPITDAIRKMKNKNNSDRY